MDNESKDAQVAEGEEQKDTSPAWLSAALADLENLDVEAPISGSKSADSHELSDLFRVAAEVVEDTAAARIFRLLSAATGMAFNPNERNDPFGPMLVFEGRRSAIPSDFEGVPADVIAAIAEKASHPTLRSCLGDLCWVLDRKKGRLATAAVASYVDLVKRVDDGSFKFHLNEKGALNHGVRDLLRRALQIGRTIGWDKSETIAARDMVVNLRTRALKNRAPVAVFWFSDLDLDFRISDPASIGQDIEDIVQGLGADPDGHIVVELWKLAARAFHFAKRDEEKHRAQSAASDQLVAMAEQQSMAMLASSLLSDAISTLHGLPGKKDRRKELRHRLIDVQSGISEEMSPFSHPFDLEDLVRDVERSMSLPNLRDKLFQFAALDHQSPDPTELVTTASESIREHPLASLFGASHHDHEGKVVHRTKGAGLGEAADDAAIQSQIARDEGIRRQITASGLIEVARQVIARDHFLSADMLARMLVHSPFVPNDLVKTFSQGFLRFFQGDFVSSLYILTPLLENSLRHVLKAYGHDVTIFDDATQTQQDRTISALFEQMRAELDAAFSVAITTDIENVFLKKPGPHLRHALSHGLLSDGHPYGHDAIYGCWLIFRLCLIPLFPFREQVCIPFDEPAIEPPATGSV